MRHEDEISDELLNAYVDDQLESAEKGRVMARINADPALEERVCDTWRVKSMVQHAYRDEQAPKRATRPRSRWFSSTVHALAASLLVVAGTVAGWLGHGLTDDSRPREFRLVMRDSGQNRVVLHVASSDPARLQAILDDAEYLLTRAPYDQRAVQLEIVANDGGVDLLRADVSPFAERIGAMRAAHRELRFIACNQALEKLRKRGVEVKLLPDAEIAPSAVEQIATRLQQGWLYVRA